MKKEYVFLLIAGILSGLIVFGGKVFANLGLSLFEIAIIPYALSIIILFPFMLFFKRFRIKRKHILILFLYGIVTSLLSLAEFGGVFLGVPVAIAVLLIYTQPLWTIILSIIFLKEKINKFTAIACILVIIGVFILVGPAMKDFMLNAGLLVSLLGGVLLSVWVIMGRVSSTRGSHPVATQFGVGIFTIIILGVLYLLFSSLIKLPEITRFSLNFSFNIWIYLIVFALLVNILSHIFIFSGMRKVPSADAGILLLLEPVSAALLAAIFLNQALTINIIIGGILILVANYLVIKKH
jgi:drug/metabolite transporter (DMT)-like permease